MRVSFILNGEDVQITVAAETRLIDILRGPFELTASKVSCRTGNCGACSVLLDDKVVKACLVPAFKVRGSEVITAEGFSQTDEYKDISRAFAEEKVESCGFCDSATILAIEELLSKNRRPLPEEILRGLKGIKCRCTDPDALVRAVMAAVEFRRQRIYGRSS